MLIIPCPWCGPRPDSEFLCTGEAREPLRDDGPGGDPGPWIGRWTDRVWGRDNPRGPVRERWWHAHGCRLWLTVTRDTRDHRILAAAPAWEDEETVQAGRQEDPPPGPEDDGTRPATPASSGPAP
jgi:heterotetrameric sarcosine oxidase delta subunit